MESPDRILKRTTSSPAILEPNKRQRTLVNSSESSPDPNLKNPGVGEDKPKNQSLCRDDTSNEPSLDKTNDLVADDEDYTGEKEDDEDGGEENENGDSDDDNEGEESSHGEQFDDQPWLEDMEDIEREENEDLTTSDSSSSGSDFDVNEIGREYSEDDDDRYAHSSSTDNPYPGD